MDVAFCIKDQDMYGSLILAPPHIIKRILVAVATSMTDDEFEAWIPTCEVCC